MQKTAYEMRISDWSSDVCSSDLIDRYALVARHADSGKRQKLEIAILDPPDGAQLIARPGTLDVGDDLVIARTFKRPSVRTEIMLEHIDRRRTGRSVLLIEGDQAILLAQFRPETLLSSAAPSEQKPRCTAKTLWSDLKTEKEWGR